MEECIRLAKLSAAEGEVPVGACIVRDGEIVGSGRNRRELAKNALAHAEIEAIHSACTALGGWRLHECELYVTLEPCPMCAGAITNARIRRVVFGAHDPKAGCYGSVCDFQALPFNHRPEVTAGLMEDACAQLLKEFFRELRKRR